MAVDPVARTFKLQLASVTSKLHPSNFTSFEPSSLVVVVLDAVVVVALVEGDAELEDDDDEVLETVVDAVEAEGLADEELWEEVESVGLLPDVDEDSKVVVSSVIASPLLVVPISSVTKLPPLTK